MIRLWIDDQRQPPKDWRWIKTVNEAWELIKSIYTRDFFEDNAEMIEISLDHDASDEYSKFGGDYIEILNKLEYYANISTDWDQYIKKYMMFYIHSANSVGVENMRRIIKRNGWKEV